ncbi:MAG: phage portal protein [Paracoccaceae bacterium]
MNLIDRLIAPFAPGAALRRAQSRMALERIRMHYEAASVSDRTGHRRAPGTDADAAASRRDRMANVARDMIRNTPFAARAQQVIANNVVGDGIIPKLLVPSTVSPKIKKALEDRALELIERDLDTTAVDADGRQNLYGLQHLVMNTVVDAGEALILRVSEYGKPLKVRVLEPDFIDEARQGPVPGNGWMRDGIEYDAAGNRIAYWLFDQHPGADVWARNASPLSKRIPAKDVLHIYRQDRPGQMRGVSWFSSIAITLSDLGEFQDAQLMRQKIAACFVAFRQIEMQPGDARAREMEDLRPGLIQDIGADEQVTFGTPPDSGDFDPFSRAILRAAAAGMGLTYEAFTGDLSNVNFSSARMGRVEMDRNVSGWQNKMLIPAMLHPIAKWALEGWFDDLIKVGKADAMVLIREGRIRLSWTPPHKVLVDPTREIPALIEAIEGGLVSRPAVVRSLGQDPERLDEEIAADNDRMDELGLKFSSDFRHSVGVQRAQSAPIDDAETEDDQRDGAKPVSRDLPPHVARMFKGF